MTKKDLIGILMDHRKNTARVNVLAARIAEMEKAIAAAAEADLVSRGMPQVSLGSSGGGGGISSPVERSVLDREAGVESPHVIRWKAEAAALRDEWEDLKRLCYRVECALSALKDRERKVIEAHLIDGDSWTLVTLKSKRILDEAYSLGTLRALQDRGLKTMLEVLR